MFIKKLFRVIFQSLQMLKVFGGLKFRLQVGRIKQNYSDELPAYEKYQPLWFPD